MNKKWKYYWSQYTKNNDVSFKPDAQDLFQQIFEIAPAKRLSIKSIISHKWFSGKRCKQEDLENRIEKLMEMANFDSFPPESRGSDERDSGSSVSRGVHGIMQWALPRKKDNSSGENTVHDPQPVDKKENDAEVYKPIGKSWTKFKSASHPRELLDLLSELMGEYNIKYKSEGNYGLTNCTTSSSSLEFRVQVFRTEDASECIVEFVRLRGKIRDYMNCYAAIFNSMIDFIKQ
eukprot:TRINITY_DN919_c0_g1_i3.p1 TRINITY_DN919_c0_g1~~TRINITY_DN919_c0_g1_i3.p1  ORF type:complete len:233 (+),score=41.42 TRINITY_DN919_c0_g1_i3:413-1111(+)